MTLQEALLRYPGLILHDGTRYWEQDELAQLIGTDDPETLKKPVYCDPEGIWEMAPDGKPGRRLYATVRCPICHDLVSWADYTEALEGLAHTWCDAKDWH